MFAPGAASDSLGVDNGAFDEIEGDVTAMGGIVRYPG